MTIAAVDGAGDGGRGGVMQIVAGIVLFALGAACFFTIDRALGGRGDGRR